jgi:phage-related tail protein
MNRTERLADQEAALLRKLADQEAAMKRKLADQEAEAKRQLADQEAEAKRQLADTRKEIAQTKRAQLDEERKVTLRRYPRVGKLVADAGLFVLDDSTLAELFAVLAPLAEVSNPVAILDGLLSEMITPVGGVRTDTNGMTQD